MTCEHTLILLDDYLDGTLSDTQKEAVDSHCASCESCAQSLNQLQQQISLLKSLPVPPASENFKTSVIANAVAAERESTSGSHNFYKFATAAMLSALVVWLGFFNDSQVDNNELYLVTVNDEVRTIKVAIESEQALDAVDMRIELSDNLELSGFGSKKQVNWTTGLRQGVNVIALPIVGIAQGNGDITTTIRMNGKEKVMRIKTQYKSPGSVLYNNTGVLQG